jgi:RNA polymerase sigma factor (sigma-70 family)
MATPDHTLTSVIGRARDASAPVVDRHEAFGELVRRFQDLAFACAYARLRDAALAEDATQDAFLVAWERLDQLRDPEAFPGWIRRLVLTQCDRRLRSRRLALAPEDAVQGVAAPAASPIDATTAHDSTMVQLALAALGADDRLVLILFYLCERSQAEIAQWLGVPVTTIARRLAHARRRLRRQVVDALRGEFRALRRTVCDIFIVELSARLRRADARDDDGIASLWDRLDVGPARRSGSSVPACAYLLEEAASQAPIAYAAATPTVFEPIYDLQLAIGDDALRRHAGDVLLMQVIEDMVAMGAVVLRHRTESRHAPLVEFLCARGFDIVERAQDWRRAADHAARLTLAPSNEPRCDFKGLDALAAEPDLFDALLELLSDEIAADPSERPFLPLHPQALRRRLRAQRDGVIAVADGVLLGVLAGSMDQVVPAAVRVDMVLVRRNRRRQGVATAMLARLLERQAGGAARIVARESPGLTAWLRRCGFVQVADSLLLERLLRKTVHVPSEHLNEYVGHYVVEARAIAPITIERYRDTLISKVGDMRDVLLPTSEYEFFTRHHYGRGRFERDGTGRIARLVYIEGPREVVAIRQHPAGSHGTR